VRRDRPIVEGILAAIRAVDHLIGDDHVSRRNLFLERAAGRGADDALDAEFSHRPEVRTVVDDLRRILVHLAVAR
jgi:hypothetical protein